MRKNIISLVNKVSEKKYYGRTNGQMDGQMD